MTDIIPQLISQADIESQLQKVLLYETYMFSGTNVNGAPAVNFLMLRKNPASDGLQEVARVRSVGWRSGEAVFLNSQVGEAFRAANLQPSPSFIERFFRRAGSPGDPLEEEPVDPVETPIEEPSEEEIAELIAGLEDPLPPERTDGEPPKR